MSQKIKRSILIFLIFSLIYLTSCNKEGDNIPMETPLHSMTPLQVRTLTETPIPLPTNTVVPTMLPSERETEITRLMQTNDHCSGFCFWGIRSGETSFLSALILLQKFIVVKNIDNLNGDQELIDEISFDDQKFYIGLDILQKGEAVEIKEIEIQGMGRNDTSPDKWAAFTLTNYLKTNGKPEQFLISMSEGPEGRFSYFLILNYQEWAVTYYGNQTGIHPAPLNACPLGDFNIHSFTINSPRYADLGWTVEQSKLTGLSDEEFFMMLSEGTKNTCFKLDLGKYLELLNN